MTLHANLSYTLVTKNIHTFTVNVPNIGISQLISDANKLTKKFDLIDW